MFVPNLYTLHEQGHHYGLHKFQDGVVMLAVRHHCGDWIAICRATEAQVSHFERCGEAAEIAQPSVPESLRASREVLI